MKSTIMTGALVVSVAVLLLVVLLRVGPGTAAAQYQPVPGMGAGMGSSMGMMHHMGGQEGMSPRQGDAANCPYHRDDMAHHGHMGRMEGYGAGEERLPEAGDDLPEITATMTLDEWTLEPAILEVETGNMLVLTITNTGDSPHSLAIPDLGLRVPPLEPGASRTVRVPVTESGDFEVYCDLPGHRQAGQSAILRVTP